MDEEKLESEQKQEIFKSFSPEIKWTIIKPFLEIGTQAVSNKMGVLPSLSAISVAMLIVATVNPVLIPLNILSVKIIISVLLTLIPLSLFVYINKENGVNSGFLK